MSAFWDSFTAGAEAAIGEMGEDVFIGGVAMQGIVQPVGVNETLVAGGRSSGVTHQIQISLADGLAVKDGEAVECRMLIGRVLHKEHFGGGWLVDTGPENRWSEDDFS